MAGQYPDKEPMCVAPFDAALRAQLRTLATDDVVQAYLDNPAGPHPDALQRLLTYFRRAPIAGKYVVLMVKPFQAYRILALSGQRGVAPRIVDDRIFPTQEAAQKAVFLRRVRDLLEAGDGTQ